MVRNGAQPPPTSTPADGGDPLLGRVLNDKFRIVEVLGAGGMGRVYKAVQSPLERMVALKVLNPQYSQGKDPGFQKRFFLEAAVTAKLRHPNTVTIFDYGKTDDGVLYIAMEYLEGQTLAHLLSNAGALPWFRALNVAQQVARSLREAHKVGLIHRDLKPANIMVLGQEDDQDIVKVLDFGLVKSFLPDPTHVQDVEITQAGVILGSPLYMAPEQARNVSDPRSDVYSLGVVMYQMMIGRPPFVAQQSIDVIFKHINEAPPSFSALWASHNVPPEVEALVMRCLSKKPEERFQSMDEMLEVIRRAASAAGHSGVFSASRTLGNSGVMAALPSLDASGLRALGPLPTTSGARTMSLPVSAEPQASLTRRTLPLALFGATLLVGLIAAAAWSLRTPTPPAAAPAAPVAVAPALPAPPAPATAPTAPETAAPEAEPDDLAPLVAQPGVAIRLSLESEPAGAKVLYDGDVVGTTPVELPVSPNARGGASARVTFSLEGYQSVTTLVEGSGPVVRFNQKLQKKRSGSRSPTDRRSPGYKEDPY
jgi:eukaryotic-like serine/threonine-protein kinase